jgi:hypothetical protein
MARFRHEQVPEVYLDILASLLPIFHVQLCKSADGAAWLAR